MKSAHIIIEGGTNDVLLQFSDVNINTGITFFSLGFMIFINERLEKRIKENVWLYYCDFAH